jgi:predicted CoA-binding protein
VKLSVVVLGASDNPERFAFRALQMLLDAGHHAIPVNPAVGEVLGQQCYPSISDVPGPIDTVTLYLGAARSEPLIDAILKSKPRRIIFNPGAENEHLAADAARQGIEVARDCTLVMLQTGSF